MEDREWTDDQWLTNYRELFEEAEDITAVVYLAIGAGSACWENLEGAGVFESTRASILGQAVLEELRRRGVDETAGPVVG